VGDLHSVVGRLQQELQHLRNGVVVFDNEDLGARRSDARESGRSALRRAAGQAKCWPARDWHDGPIPFRAGAAYWPLGGQR
jgi:hypothetical protein